MDYHIKLPIWEQIFSILQTISRVRVGSEERLRRFVEAIGHVVKPGANGEGSLLYMVAGEPFIADLRDGLTKAYGIICLSTPNLHPISSK